MKITTKITKYVLPSRLFYSANIKKVFIGKSFVHKSFITLGKRTRYPYPLRFRMAWDAGVK